MTLRLRPSPVLALAVALGLPLASPASAAETATTPTPTTQAATAAATGTDLVALGSALGAAYAALLQPGTATDTTTFSLPDTLKKIQAAAKVAGKSELVDGLATKLNTASDNSFASALETVSGALADVPWSEAKNLAAGGDTAVTDFIRKTTAKKLRAQLLPVVQKSVAAAGVPDQYKQLLAAAGPAASLFGKPGVADLEGYVTDKTLDSVFAYLAKQETALRANPALAENPTVQKAFALLTGK